MRKGVCLKQRPITFCNFAEGPAATGARRPILVTEIVEFFLGGIRYYGGDEMPVSKRIPRPKQHKHSSRLGTLVKKMSEVISLRERVAQAELAARIARAIEEQAPETIFRPKVLDDKA